MQYAGERGEKGVTGFAGQRVSHSLKVKLVLLNVQVQSETLPLGAKHRLTSHRHESPSAHVFQIMGSSEIPGTGKEKWHCEMVTEGGPHMTHRFGYTLTGKPHASLTQSCAHSLRSPWISPGEDRSSPDPQHSLNFMISTLALFKLCSANKSLTPVTPEK